MFRPCRRHNPFRRLLCSALGGAGHEPIRSASQLRAVERKLYLQGAKYGHHDCEGCLTAWGRKCHAIPWRPDECALRQ
ncbi:unnamed protein product, partial [Symbiodinium necroappetens]